MGKSGIPSISIKTFTKAENEEESKTEKIIADPSHYGSKEFTVEEFLKSWEKLAERVAQSDDEGKSMVFAALTTHQPVLMENRKVLVKVDNLSQLEEVMHKRTDLHEFLRNDLQNGEVEIQLEILKNKKEKKAYTQDEKLKVMAEKNPLIMDLKKTLGLDFI